MTRREIFESSMNHRGAERVLIDHGKQVGSIHKYIYDDIRQAAGLPPSQDVQILDRMSQCVVSEEHLLQAFGIDFRWLEPRWTQITDIDENSYRNLFGVLFRNMGDYYSVADAPMKDYTVSDIDRYAWPNTNDPGMFAGLREQASAWFNETDYVIGADGVKGGVFQTSLELRGYEQFYVDLVVDPDLAHAVLRRVTDTYKSFYEKYLSEVGQFIQLVYITDDFGSQDSLLMSPSMWADFLKPYEADLIAHIKKLAPHVKVMFHTDGSVLPIMDGLIEMGVDILNPVQTSVTELQDTRRLNEQYGDRICFHGAIDVQKLLNHASPAEIREDVKRRIADLGAGGGYIVATCHNIGHDIPPENVCALYEAARDFASYSS